MKKNFLLIGVIIILVIITLGIYINKNKEDKIDNNVEEEVIENYDDLLDRGNLDNASIKDGKKENTSETLINDKVYKELKISEISLKEESGMSNFTAKVENTTSNDIEEQIVKLKFKKQDGSDYAELEVSIPTVKANDVNYINAYTTNDIINSYDFTIEDIVD